MAQKTKLGKGGVRRAVPRGAEGRWGLSSIEVEGFKAIGSRTEMAIRPLTILAGANSSGKSSIMQPLLLMKQTLEAPTDPGVFLLDGPNVKFTAASQVVSRFGKEEGKGFGVRFRFVGGDDLALTYERAAEGGFEISRMLQSGEAVEDMAIPRGWGSDLVARPVRDRCFLSLAVMPSRDATPESVTGVIAQRSAALVRGALSRMIHLPAMRGNPERNYRTTAVGPEFPGTFEPYVASVVHQWQSGKDPRIQRLGEALARLGLTWGVDASRVDDTRIELKVGRSRERPSEGPADLVSIADVGFGVSQCLPVLVAALVAVEGQLLYIEEPEIHLHPRAQFALAEVLADAANRGVRVVVETHSSLLLTGVQALVAEGKLSPGLVALHWFSRDKVGRTHVRSAELDEGGAFGDWPEDFAEVALDAQARYLDAAERRLTSRKR